MCVIHSYRSQEVKLGPLAETYPISSAQLACKYLLRVFLDAYAAAEIYERQPSVTLGVRLVESCRPDGNGNTESCVLNSAAACICRQIPLLRQIVSDVDIDFRIAEMTYPAVSLVDSPSVV